MVSTLDDSIRTALANFVSQFKPSREYADIVLCTVGIERLLELLFRVEHANDVELICGAVERLLSFPDIEAALLRDEQLCTMLILQGCKNPIVTVKVLLSASLLRASKRSPPVIPKALIPVLVQSLSSLLRDTEIAVAQPASSTLIELIRTGLLNVETIIGLLHQCTDTTRLVTAETRIRGLELALGISELNDASFDWIAQDGFFNSLLTVCSSNGDDVLLQLAALELLERLSHNPRGIEWMTDQSLNVNVPQLILKNIIDNPVLEGVLTAAFLRMYESLIEVSSQPEQLATPFAPHLVDFINWGKRNELRTLAGLRLMSCLSRRTPTVLLLSASDSFTSAVSLALSLSTPTPLRNSALEALAESSPSLIKASADGDEKKVEISIQNILVPKLLNLLANGGTFVDSRAHMFRLLTVLFKSITNIRQSTCTAAAFREMLLDQSIDMDAPVRARKRDLIVEILESFDYDVLIALGGPDFPKGLQSIVDAGLFSTLTIGADIASRPNS